MKSKFIHIVFKFMPNIISFSGEITLRATPQRKARTNRADRRERLRCDESGAYRGMTGFLRPPSVPTLTASSIFVDFHAVRPGPDILNQEGTTPLWEKKCLMTTTRVFDGKAADEDGRTYDRIILKTSALTTEMGCSREMVRARSLLRARF